MSSKMNMYRKDTGERISLELPGCGCLVLIAALMPVSLAIWALVSIWKRILS